MSRRPVGHVSVERLREAEQQPFNLSDHELERERQRPVHKQVPDKAKYLSRLGKVFASLGHMESQKPDLNVDRGRVLGSGGFGIVYAGSLDQGGGATLPVAIKTCHLKFTNIDVGMTVAKVGEEVRNWQHINPHPFVCQLLDHFVVDDSFWFVVEFADRGDLYDLCHLQKNNRLDVLLARHLFRQISSGINYMHARGIAHRDIKAENILMFTSNDTPYNLTAKLSDFGLSIVAWTHGNGINRASNNSGTARYMPPEILFHLSHYVTQVNDSIKGPYAGETSMTPKAGWHPRALLFHPSVTPRDSLPIQHRDYHRTMTSALNNDTYALGVLIFVMMTGHYPMSRGQHPVLRLNYVMRGKMIKFSFMPQMCREFIRSMLEPDPVKRATIRCIIDHDWLRDNPPVRRKRRGEERTLPTATPCRSPTPPLPPAASPPAVIQSLTHVQAVSPPRQQQQQSGSSSQSSHTSSSSSQMATPF